jgi:hypothetical protein
MKSLAGANQDDKLDYRTQALSDAEKGERFVSGDVYDLIILLFFLNGGILIFFCLSKYQRSWWQHDQNYKSGFRMLKLTMIHSRCARLWPSRTSSPYIIFVASFLIRGIHYSSILHDVLYFVNWILLA